MKDFFAKIYGIPSTFNIHPQMRVCGFFRESFGPQKSLKLTQYSSHPQKHEPEEMNSIRHCRCLSQAQFRRGECTQAMGLCDLYILLGVSSTSSSAFSIVSLSSSASSSLFHEQLLLVEVLPMALLPTSWAPVTIHLPCGITGDPCVWWITHQLDYSHSFRLASLLTLEPRGCVLCFCFQIVTLRDELKTECGNAEWIASTFIVTMY